MMTRETDVYHTPYQKAKYGNQVGADIFVSIHCNAAASESAHGTETLSYDLDGESYKLAKAIQESLIAVTNLTDRGVKQRKDLIVLNSTTMPAALVETAFISNKEEKLLLMDEAFRQKIAAAIANGIDSYFGKESQNETENGKDQNGEGKNMTVEEAKKVIQEKCGFDDNTMLYLSFYRYADSMLTRLAEAMK